MIETGTKKGEQKGEKVVERSWKFVPSAAPSREVPQYPALIPSLIGISLCIASLVVTRRFLRTASAYTPLEEVSYGFFSLTKNGAKELKHHKILER